MSKIPSFVERFRALDALDIKDGQIDYQAFEKYIQKAGYTDEYQKKLMEKFEAVSGGDCKIHINEFLSPKPAESLSLARMLF